MSPSTMIPNDDWQPCQPGTIGPPLQKKGDRVQAAEQAINRRGALLLFSGLCGGGIVVAGITLFALYWPTTKPVQILPAEIGCVQVHQHLVALITNQVEDNELRTQISCHLNHCSGCQQAFQKLNAGGADECAEWQRRQGF